MTAAVSGPPLTAPVSVRVLLLGDDTDLQSLHRQLAEHGVLTEASRLASCATTVTGARVEDEVTTLLAGLLELDLGAMLLAGWETSQQLREARTRTRGAPGTSERVVLAHHVVTARHTPRLELRLAGHPAGRLEFEVAVELDLLGLEAEVRDGAVVALPCGSGEASATLSTAGRVLLASPRRRFSPGLVLPLGRGSLPQPRSG